jgi:hypothetical protein
MFFYYVINLINLLNYQYIMQLITYPLLYHYDQLNYLIMLGLNQYSYSQIPSQTH